MAKRVVLISGVSSTWGRRVAAQLITAAGAHNLHVLGVDAQPPKQEIKELDFIQADVRNLLLVELFKSEAVHTVCHLAFAESARLSESAFDLNVMGTLNVMGACAEAGVKKVVLKSSTAVYGARPDNSAFLDEDHPLNGARRDVVEIEALCGSFRRQSPQIMLTVLRFASIIGPTCDTPMMRFLNDSKTPVLLGFDPMMQVIHEDDVVGALAHAVLYDAPGTFNIAADGNLPLSKLTALAGKLSVPVFHLLAYWFGPLASSLRDLAPIEWDYLRYPWVGDLAKMKKEFGYAPRYSAVDALRECAAQRRLRPYAPESAEMVDDQERLRETIERRRQARSVDGASGQQPAIPSEEQEAGDE